MNPEDEERLVDPDRLPEAQDEEEIDDPGDASVAARPAPSAENDALEDQARGHSVTAEDAPDALGEVDAMAKAAGLPPDRGQPITEIVAAQGQRDEQRWELDPRSSEDYAEREADDPKRKPRA